MKWRIALLVIALLSPWSQPVEAARKPAEPSPPTLQDLATGAVPIDRAQPVTADPEQAARSYEDFLKIEGSDPALRAQALRRVGDLRLAEAESLRGEEGTSSADAVAAAKQAIAAYQRLLKDYPEYPSTDAVLYQLARACETAGDPAQALTALDELVTRYPKTSHYDEAQFRRGETSFSLQRYADAERAYAAVLALEPKSEFDEQALYKRGWALFKLSRDKESSESFLTLLDRELVVDGAVRPLSQLSRPERELTEDTLRALSLMFIASDGPVSLQAALAAHGTVPYESQLYGALGELYVEKERYQDGAEAYRAFSRRQPMSLGRPAVARPCHRSLCQGWFHLAGA